MKNKIIKVMCISICMTMLFVSGGVGTTKVLASRETETKNCDFVETPTGTADFERGNASITIRGNGGQSLRGKIFRIYQLFRRKMHLVENLSNIHSIQTTRNQ